VALSIYRSIAKEKKISLHNHFLVWKETNKSNTIEREVLFVPFLPKINIKNTRTKFKIAKNFPIQKN
jgi:hypothetical protein